MGRALFAVVAVFLFAFAGLGLLRFASLPAWVNRYLEVSTPFAALGTWALALVGIIIAAADVPNVGPLVGLGLGLRSTAPALLIWAGAMLVVAEFLITKVKKPAGPVVMEPKF